MLLCNLGIGRHCSQADFHTAITPGAKGHPFGGISMSTGVPSMGISFHVFRQLVWEYFAAILSIFMLRIIKDIVCGTILHNFTSIHYGNFSQVLATTQVMGTRIMDMPIFVFKSIINSRICA